MIIMVLQEQNFCSLPAVINSSKPSGKRTRTRSVTNVTRETTKSVTDDCFNVVKHLLPLSYRLPSADIGKSGKTKSTKKERKEPLKAGRGHRKTTKTAEHKRGGKMKEKKLDRLHEKSGKKIESETHKKDEDVETDNKYMYEKKESQVIQKFDNDKIEKDKLESEKEHSVLKTETEDETDSNILLEESGLDINDIYADDDSTTGHNCNKENRERKREAEKEKNLTENKPNSHQVVPDKKYALENEKQKKLVVKIPASDNRHAEEREKESQEQTHVKTRDLLTLDVDRNFKEERHDETVEKEDFPEKSTAQYSDMPCRGSLQNEAEENCESFLTRVAEEREGVEHSYYSEDEFCQSALPSHSEESLPLSKEKSESWESLKEVAGDPNFQEQDKIQAKLESHCLKKKDADVKHAFSRLTEQQEEDSVVAIETEREELSEKEKISLTNDDEKDDCECDVSADMKTGQAQDDNVTGESEIREGAKDQKCQEGLVVENSVVDPENGEKVEKRRPESRSAVDDTSKGPRSVAFEQDITEINDLAIAANLSHPFTYILLVVKDTVLFCITMEIKQHGSMETTQEENRMVGNSPNCTGKKKRSSRSLRCLAECAIQEPSLKKAKPSKAGGHISVNKRSSKLFRSRGLQRSDRGQERSRPKICRQKRKKSAHVKWSKKDKMIGTPDRCGGSRRLPWLQGVGCGRRCSDGHSGGTQGGGYLGNSGSGEEGSGDNGQTGRRNENNNDSDKNNNHNSYRGGNSGDFGENGSGDRNRKPQKRSSAQSNPEDEDSNIPDSDFKRYKKKHNQVGFDDFMSFIGRFGAIIEERKGPVCELGDNPIRDCISCSMEAPDELSEERISCDICNVLNSMLKHFADCQELYLACTMCMQVFSFICIHAYECKMNQYECEIKLCKKFHQVLGTDTLSVRMKCLWFSIKKKLARVLGFDDGVMTSASNIPVNPPNLTSLGGPRGYNPSLDNIPETGSEGSTSRSGSRVLARKRSNKLPSLPETESLPPDVPVTVSGELVDDSGRATVVEQAPQSREAEAMYRRFPPVRKITPSRYTSLPVTGGVEGHYGQYPSFTDKPVGTPGICEVMYGNVRRLVVVSKNWSELKAMYEREEPLPRPYREEGIILRPYSEYLIIDEIRYQLEFQWVKISHLGNGMSGKCHLATDFQTEFKFCVKEIHISKFEVEEIELWSDLDHCYIVKLYGAIRHGEMIYIFSEFIDGGNLTEAINTQRALNRRLSHRTALTLFRQLLEVLVYLKAKNILHEDLKADNILLQREKDSISIKVTDFGLATRINMAVRVGTKPVGTMTQWSPEKAECVGHGYPAEIWAAVCVLVHMVSGLPPWMRRYPELKSLIVVIVQQSPPVEDIPRNIPKVVRDLIERGFTVCQGQRPTPEELLKHEAFKLITGQAPRNDAYSILDSTFHIDNTELEDKNSDLQEIIKDLEKKKSRSNVSISEDINRIVSGVQSIHVADGVNRLVSGTQGVPLHDVPEGLVYMLPNVKYEAQDGTSGGPAKGNIGPPGNSNANAAAVQLSGSNPEVSDENPLQHYHNFIIDDVSNIHNLGNVVTPYHPGMENVIEETQFLVHQQELENRALNALIPDFEKIMASSSDPTVNDYDDDSGEDETEAPFDFNKQIQEVQKKYLTPTEEKERNPMLPMLPLVIESLFTTSLETRPSYSLTDSVTSNKGTSTSVSGTVPTESGAEFRESWDPENPSNTENAEVEENRDLETGLDTENPSNTENAEVEENRDLETGLDTEQVAASSVANIVYIGTTTEEEQFPSDELFISGPGDAELVATMDRMSVTANTSVATPETQAVAPTVPTPSISSPGVTGDDDLFGPQFSLKQDDGDKIDMQQPVFSHVCTPSRNAEIALRQAIGEVNYQQSQFTGVSEPNSTRLATKQNNNAQQTSGVMQPPSLNHTRFNLQAASYDIGGQFNSRLQMPSTIMQPNYQPGTFPTSPGQYPPMTNPLHQLGYPYSFAGQQTRYLPVDPYSLSESKSSPSFPKKAANSPNDESKVSANLPRNDSRTPKNEPDRRTLKNPRIEMPNSKFTMGPPSSTSSSGSQGELYPSPIFPPQNSGSPDPGLGIGDGQLGSPITQMQFKTTASPQSSQATPIASVSSETSYTLYNRNNSATSPSLTSYNTSTPVKIPRKGKQAKDAMNEMLKSYQATHGPLEEVQIPELAPPQQSTPSTSPQLQRQRLHLNVNPQGPAVGPVLHVRSAPTLERRPSYPPDHHRVSHAPQSATPPKGNNRWPSDSPGSGSASTSARSQLEEQTRALEELQRELETSSHHSQSHSESNLHLSLFEREGDNDDAIEDPLDDHFSSEETEAAREALLQSQYITNVEERRVTVLVICPNRSTPIRMKFSSYHRSWRDIVKDDLCRSAAIHNDVGCDRFCLKFQDGTPVDLNQPLGDQDVTVFVVCTTDDDPWCVEGGHIFFTR